MFLTKIFVNLLGDIWVIFGNFTCGNQNYYSRNKSKFRAEPELVLAETSQSYAFYLAFFCQDKTGVYVVANVQIQLMYTLAS